MQNRSSPQSFGKIRKERKTKGCSYQNIDGLHQAAGSETVYELMALFIETTVNPVVSFTDLKI